MKFKLKLKLKLKRFQAMSYQSLSQISQLSGCNNWASTLPCLLPLYYNNDYNNYHDDGDDNNDHYADFNNDCAVLS